MVVLENLVFALQGKNEDMMDLHAVVFLAFVRYKVILGYQIIPISYGPQGIA